MGRASLLLFGFLAVVIFTAVIATRQTNYQTTDSEVVGREVNIAANETAAMPAHKGGNISASSVSTSPSPPLIDPTDASSGTDLAEDNSRAPQGSSGPIKGDGSAQDTLEEPENQYTNTGEVLSQEVFEIIDEVQKRFLEGQWTEGTNELNALYEDYDSLNDFEKATVLNFYTNLLLANNMLPEAMNAFEAMLQLETLRPDLRLRAIRAMGQLNRTEGQLESAVAYFNQFLDESGDRNSTVLLDLAYSHYQLGQHSEAIPPLTEHIEQLIVTDQEVERNKLSLLNVLAIESGDWDSAATVNELMVEAYNDPRDWQNLAEIYQQLGENAQRQQLLSDALDAGHIDGSGNWLHLEPQ